MAKDEKVLQKTVRVPFRTISILGHTLRIFSHLMSIVLSRMEGFAIAYLDDILIFSKDPKEQFRHSHLVFDRLKQYE